VQIRSNICTTFSIGKRNIKWWDSEVVLIISVLAMEMGVASVQKKVGSLEIHLTASRIQ